MFNETSLLLVKSILSQAHCFDWSVQGFGMFRLYLDKATRLHVWDDRFRVEKVSDIHTHPWDFDSEVLTGRLYDHRFLESDRKRFHEFMPYVPMDKVRIRCGENACTVSEPERVWLCQHFVCQVTPGNRYSAVAEDTHCTQADNGTVTVIKRHFKSDTEHAYVYCRPEDGWVDAKPRKAALTEIRAMAELALKNF